MPHRQRNKVSAGIDWITIFVWAALACIGIACIYSSTYSEDTQNIFSLSSRSGRQALWYGVAVFAVFVILFVVNAKAYQQYAMSIYVAAVALMLITLIFGRTINGSKSWLNLWAINIQSVEFLKIATALLVSKIMSNQEVTSMNKWSSFMRTSVPLLLSMALTQLQGDTGSTLVFASFLIVFYRFGLKPWVVFGCVLMVGLFVASLLFEDYAVLIALSASAFLFHFIESRRFKQDILWIAIIAAVTAALYYGLQLFERNISLYHALLIAHAAAIPFVIVYSLWQRHFMLLTTAGVFILSVGVCYSVDYVFDHVLKEHQRNRINITLGLDTDIRGAGYNIHQSKIAIGSGGFTGKGFLQGTQTKYNFVPEQSTDFIFCTVGEEWGFAGCMAVMGLFLLLLYRIIVIAERQVSRFSKLYGYCIAGILFFHIFVNLGMTIGILPVLGIPLPFVSYGGSSLLAFTVLLFILLRLDVARRER